MKRKTILEKAMQCVCQDRELQYGSPENNFTIIAHLWDIYLKAKKYYRGFNFNIDAHDVAIMMALLKIGRTTGGHIKEDNYVDLAGYAACAGELTNDNKQ